MIIKDTKRSTAYCPWVTKRTEIWIMVRRSWRRHPSISNFPQTKTSERAHSFRARVGSPACTMGFLTPQSTRDPPFRQVILGSNAAMICVATPCCSVFCITGGYCISGKVDISSVSWPNGVLTHSAQSTRPSGHIATSRLQYFRMHREPQRPCGPSFSARATEKRMLAASN